MKDRLKNAEEAKKFREELLAAQSGIDPILGIKITQPVLDHMHYPPFKCRRVLQSEVNAFEGKIFNAHRRYIRHLSNKSLIEVLRALIAYYEVDDSDKPIHHTGINDELRPFRKAKAETQITVLQNMKIEPADNAKKRIKQMRIALQTGVISYNDLIEKLRFPAL